MLAFLTFCQGCSILPAWQQLYDQPVRPQSGARAPVLLVSRLSPVCEASWHLQSIQTSQEPKLGPASRPTDFEITVFCFGQLQRTYLWTIIFTHPWLLIRIINVKQKVHVVLNLKGKKDQEMHWFNILLSFFGYNAVYHDLLSRPQDHLPDNSLDNRVTWPCAVTLINQLVMSAATIQVLVLICRLGGSSLTANIYFHNCNNALFQFSTFKTHPHWHQRCHPAAVQCSPWPWPRCSQFWLKMLH